MNRPIQFVPEVLKWDDMTYEDNRQMRRDLPPGAAHWISSLTSEYGALDFTCPCGCGTVHCIPICTGTKVERAWLWDGDVANPTLSPSIQCLSPCRWHGFLRKGIWEQC